MLKVFCKVEYKEVQEELSISQDLQLKQQFSHILWTKI